MIWPFRRREPAKWWSCDFANEMTILSNGDITTCCVDDQGRNAFANIFDHDVAEVVARHGQFKRTYLDMQTGDGGDASAFPGCRSCLRNPKARFYMHEVTNPASARAFVQPLEVPCDFVMEISARCNATCAGCIHKRLDNDLGSVREGHSGVELDLDRALAFLRPIGAKLRYIRLYNYGEPFLHKKIDWFCRQLVALSPNVTIGISTNGTAFGSDERIGRILDAGINHIIVSLHGGSEATSKKYMGERFPFDKAVDNITRLMAAKKARGQAEPMVDLKCVLFEWNDSDEEMDSFRALASQLGVDAYHFWATNGPGASKRYPHGSAAWDDLVARGLDSGGLHREIMNVDQRWTKKSA
jgi:hypothetical protein